MECWKCKKDLRKIKDNFEGNIIDAWQCPKCKEIIYDEDVIQPILEKNKERKK